MASPRYFTPRSPGRAGRERLAGRTTAARGNAGLERSRRPPALWLVSGVVCVAVAALIGLGYVATSQWLLQTELLLERRKAEMLALASAALTRDMNGAWATVLAPVNPKRLEEDPPNTVLQTAAASFARFSYPESFIVWNRSTSKDGTSKDATFALHRPDRLPPWDRAWRRVDPFPVALSRDPLPLTEIVERLAAVPADQSFVSMKLAIKGSPYQIIAHVFFSSEPTQRASSAIAFTVNLEWVRERYFGPLLRQAVRIGGNETALSLTVVDAEGQFVAMSGPRSVHGRTLFQNFPLLFMEPAVLTEPTEQVAQQPWSLQVNPAAGTIASGQGSTLRLFALIAVAAAASVVALLLTVRRAQVKARAASMKLDLVSSVTHDLKTPMALIRMVGDTLSRGRYTSPETVQEYAGLISHEAARLNRSIDNLLTYARHTEGGKAGRIELVPLDIVDVVEDALDEFRPLLAERGFDFAVEIPRTLPKVAVDSRAMTQAIQNVVDNSIKYSGVRRLLHIRGEASGGDVTVTFEDCGQGVSGEDLERVFERFYRGRNVREGGSGLGLAIAKCIIERHGGNIAMRSTVGIGTEVDIALPGAG